VVSCVVVGLLAPLQESADTRHGQMQLACGTSYFLRYGLRHGKESEVRQEQSIPVLLSSIMLCSGLLAGCHHAAAPVTEEDVAKAQADAQKEIDEARLEARKDVKNAMKQAGADSKNVTVARVTGSFDVAMANAEGDHKVAIEKCLLLAPDAQQPCKDQADAQYQAAAASAKAARVSKLQAG
jgi:hypothetical protein